MEKEGPSSPVQSTQPGPILSIASVNIYLVIWLVFTKVVDCGLHSLCNVSPLTLT